MSYMAVNVKTKEHIRINNMRDKPPGVEWKVAAVMPDGFIQYSPHPASDWRYGKLPNEQPVADNEAIAVLFRDGTTDKGVAWEYDWKNFNDPSDIIAYQPLYARTYLEEPVGDEGECSRNPYVRHGFKRKSSHTQGRYLCDCEYFGIAQASCDLEDIIGEIHYSPRAPTNAQTKELIRAASAYLWELDQMEG